MIGALRYEWVRIRTVKSSWFLALLSVASTVLFTWGGWSGADGSQRSYADALTSAGALPPLLMGILGVFAFGHEYRYGVIRPTLTSVPLRWRVALAKLLVVTAWAAVTVVLSVAGSVAFLSLFSGKFRSGVGFTGGPTDRIALGIVVYTVLFAWVGLALGWLLRNVPGAISLLIIFPLVVENLILALLSIDALEPIRGAGKYLPFAAGTQMFAYDAGSANADAPSGFQSDLTALQGGLTFGIFAVVVLAIAYVLFQKRDA